MDACAAGEYFDFETSFFNYDIYFIIIIIIS